MTNSLNHCVDYVTIYHDIDKLIGRYGSEFANQFSEMESSLTQ